MEALKHYHQTQLGAKKLAFVFYRKVISVGSNPEK